MFEIKKAADREKGLKYLVSAVRELLAEEKDLIANLANISAFINGYLDDLNWAGFYLMRENELVLGPFQGKPACIRIKPGSGVCGAAVQRRANIRVEDVHAFPGHIACDSDSSSELVLPIYRRGEVFGVIDLDSPSAGRFGQLEEDYLDQVARLLDDYLEGLE